jgi:hypothetical protein
MTTDDSILVRIPRALVDAAREAGGLDAVCALADATCAAPGDIHDHCCASVQGDLFNERA